MTQTEIIFEFKQMPLHQQMETVRAALEIIAAKFRCVPKEHVEKLPIEEAAELMLADYQNDEELTAFTALDGEEFHVTQWINEDDWERWGKQIEANDKCRKT